MSDTRFSTIEFEVIDNSPLQLSYVIIGHCMSLCVEDDRAIVYLEELTNHLRVFIDAKKNLRDIDRRN